MELRIYAFYRFSQYFMLLLNTFPNLSCFYSFSHKLKLLKSQKFCFSLSLKIIVFIITPNCSPFFYSLSYMGSILIPKSYSNYYCFIYYPLTYQTRRISNFLYQSLLTITILSLFYLLITLIMFVSNITYCILILILLLHINPILTN